MQASERAVFTARRKAAYEALHPQSIHDGDRKSDQVARAVKIASLSPKAKAAGRSASQAALLAAAKEAGPAAQVAAIEAQAAKLLEPRAQWAHVARLAQTFRSK